MLKLIRRTYVFIFLIICFFLPSLLSAKELAPLQEQARFYRNQGIEFQNQGRLDEAMVCYQKAITLDPNFVIAYNDLGIIYEAKGLLDRAEEVYLSALEVEPNYSNLYSNLAMLCEQKGEYKRAATFWKKRIKLGSPDDPWLKKAKKRLRVLAEFEPTLKKELLRQEAIELAQELSNKKRIKRSNDLAEASRLFDDAKRLHQNAEYEKALNSIILALTLDPEDKEPLLRLRDEINTRLIEQEKKARIAEMETYFQKAMRYYQQDNLQEAKRQLDKIATEITSTSLKNN